MILGGGRLKNNHTVFMIELEQEQKHSKKMNYQEFSKNLQTAVLLALLKEKQLTKWQFDLCLEELEKRCKNSFSFDSKQKK